MALSAAVVNSSRTYGLPNETFSVTFTGFVAGDGAGDLTGALAFDTVAMAFVAGRQLQRHRQRRVVE